MEYLTFAYLIFNIYLFEYLTLCSTTISVWQSLFYTHKLMNILLPPSDPLQLCSEPLQKLPWPAMYFHYFPLIHPENMMQCFLTSGVHRIFERVRGENFPNFFQFSVFWQRWVSQAGVWGRSPQLPEVNEGLQNLQPLCKFWIFFLAKVTLFDDHFWLNLSTNCFKNI